MTYNLPDPRFEEPNLLLPGQKPTGAVEIDWSKPLARGLQRCLLFDVPGSDIVSGKVFSEVSGSQTPVYGTTDKGLALRCGGAASDEYSRLDIDCFDFFGISSINEPRSISVLVRVDFVSVRGVIFQAGAGSASAFCILYAAAGNYTASVSNWSLQTATVAYTLGQWQWVTFTYDGDSATKSLNIYADGVKGIGNTSTASANVAGDTFIGEGFGGLYNREFDGDIAALFVHNRELSEFEVKALHRDPYQFLIPA